MINGIFNTTYKYNKPMPKRVVVIDDFTTKQVYLDFDFKPDATHGEVVSRFIEEGLPSAQIDKINIKTNNLSNIIGALEKVLSSIDSGIKYDALNMSFGNFFNIKYLAQILDKNINEANINKYKNDIKNWLNTANVDDNGKQIRKIIQLLDNISSHGVPIYLSAGNAGKENFNLFSLAEKSVTVGALNKDNKTKSKFNCSLVDKWTQGCFSIRKLTDKKGHTGFDYTGDGTIDKYTTSTSSYTKWANPYGIYGSSFASPRQLVQDLLKTRQ